MRPLREPLLHFLLIGGVLFAVDAALRGPAEPDDQVIQITTADIDRLRTQRTGQYRQPRSPAELQGLVDVDYSRKVGSSGKTSASRAARRSAREPM